MVSKQEVKHIAKLARLGLSEKEIEKAEKDLSQIFDYFNLLNQVDTSKIEIVFHPTNLKNVLREDRAKQEENVDKMIEQCPDKKGRFVKVKAILH